MTVSARVLTNDGRGLPNAIVMMTDSNGSTRTARTSSFGYFRFESVAAGEIYIFRISSKRFTFEPQIEAVSDEIAEMIFTAAEPAP